MSGMSFFDVYFNCNLFTVIDSVLSAYGKLLEQYLNYFFHQPEGLVEVASLVQEDDEPNKLIISLLNIERETTRGISGNIARGGNGFYSGGNPSIYANLFIVMAAIFKPKRYRESLSVISQGISFLQNTPVFDVGYGNKYTIEPVTLSWQDQSNIWTGFGGKYYPSIVCKIRGVIFDADEIKRVIPEISNPNISLK